MIADEQGKKHSDVLIRMLDMGGKVAQELRKDAMFAEGEKHYKSGAFL
jgi:hypothetical protein